MMKIILIGCKYYRFFGESLGLSFFMSLLNKRMSIGDKHIIGGGLLI